MKNLKIFLASSFELKKDRRHFEIFINRQNKEWVSKGVFLELVIWETFLDKVSKTRLQDEYNKAIEDCDIFLMLFSSKVGKYTEEEFDTAFNSFKANNKPILFTYFKDVTISVKNVNSDIITLLNFKEKLDSLGHFYTMYKSIEELQLKFNQQLQKLASEGFIKLSKQAKKTTKGIYRINKTDIRGKSNKVFQGIKNSSFKETHKGNKN